MKRILFVLAVFAFIACSSEKVSVLSTNIPESGEIEDYNNIIIEFDRGLAPDTVLNEWIDTDYIEFSPALDGSFQWLAPNQLIFSPAGPLEPETDYKGKITGKIFEFSSPNLTLEEDEISFSSTKFSIVNTTLKWGDPDSDGNPGLLLGLTFSKPVKTSDLIEKIKITSDGKNIDVMESNLSSGTVIPLYLSAGKELQGETLEIEIAEGILLTGDVKSREAVKAEIEVPELSALNITGIKPISNIGDMKIQVLTNISLKKGQDFQKLIKFKPSVKFETEVNEYGLLIKGNFQPTESYDMEVSKSLGGNFGKPLERSFKTVVTFIELEPMVNFTEKGGMYLSSAGARNIGLKIVSLEKIKVSVFKVYENNLQAFISGGKHWDYHYDNDRWHDYNYYPAERYGDLVFSKEYNSKEMERSSNASLLNLDFSDKLKRFDGLYVVRAEAPDKRWISDDRIVSISDIGLLVKKSGDEIFVAANSIKTATPLSGAKINIFSSKNQQMMSKVTNSAGIAIFEGIENSVPEFIPSMISAEKSGEINYMMLDNMTEVKKYKYDNLDGVSGKGYKTFLYGDRDLYRPGDTIVIAGILRDENIVSMDELPLKVEILLPNSRAYKEYRVTTDYDGAFEMTDYIPQNVVTGIYTIRVSMMNGEILKTRRVNIEEFIPDKINATFADDEKTYSPGDEIPVIAKVINLYGTPASGTDFEIEFYLRKKYIESKKLPDYSFNLFFEDNLTPDDFKREGQTDENGFLKVEFEIPGRFENLGMLEAVAELTAFDETGRFIRRNNRYSIQAQKYFAGIGNFTRYADLDRPLRIPFAVVDKDGELSKGKVQVKVVRYEWESIMRRNTNGNYYFESQKIERTESDREITINGKTEYSFTPVRPGSYEVRVSLPDANSYVKQSFYAYSSGWGNTADFNIDKEGGIEIVADKPDYSPGENAKILFKAPFDGRLIVTLERDKVYRHFTTTVTNRVALLEIPLAEENIPNAYISAVLLKPLTNTGIPLTVAYGYKPIFIKKKSDKIPVEIEMKEKSGSNTTHKVRVKTPGRANVNLTIAAVDEGILQITGYKPADPYKFFYRKNSLDVSMYSLYPYLFPELMPGSANFGGGSGDILSVDKRSNPLKNKRVKLLAHWSGIIKTNSNGVAEYEFEIPEFSGSVRVMAVAWQGRSFGSAEKNLQVADPVVISSGVPRFLSPGDKFIMPVNLSNTTKQAINARVSIKTKNGLKSSRKNYSVKLQPGKEASEDIEIVADYTTGPEKIEIITEYGGKKYRNTTDITIRPAASLVKDEKSGSLAGGKSLEFSPADNFMESSIGAALAVSSSPLVEFIEDFEYLIGYPHGCAEQTISKAFPQLVLADIFGTEYFKNKKYLGREAAENVRYGIDKLQSMQNFDGGIGFWQGYRNSDWWVSAYAGHFLYEAKKAGYKVNETSFSSLLGFLRDKAQLKETRITYERTGGNQWTRQENFKKENIYSLYVMALAGKPDIGLMNHYRSNSAKLSDDMKFMLAAAYRLTGDMREFSNFVPASFSAREVRDNSSGSFSSEIRDLAVALYTLVKVDKGNGMIANLSKHLADKMKNKRYLSTQERSFGLLALAEIQNSKQPASISAEIFSGGKKAASLSGFDTKNIESGKNKVKISNTGNSELYYSYISEGIPKDGKVVEKDNFLKARRRYLTPEGSEIAGNKFERGDMIVVELSLELLESKNRIENIVVTDMLPAGFEIDNPRLNGNKEFEWIENQDEPEHSDFRDDRINFFTNIGPEPNRYYGGDTYKFRKFYYVVRAVTRGEFKLGPVSADAMYDGEYHSYHGAGKITVE